MNPPLIRALSGCLMAGLLSAAGSPADDVYPKGDSFPFMGYSGQPSRDRLHGFTMTGPDYGTAFSNTPEGRERRLEGIRKAGLPTVGFVGLNMRFHDAKRKPDPEEAELRAGIKRQVDSLKDDPLVAWWYLTPEELRFWRKNEIDYLRIATETIRANDPAKRPIWMYEPNHRNSEALAETGLHQDIIGKGCYVNLAGFEKDRIWVRWSIEQELAAIRKLAAKDHRQRFALVIPELCADPHDPAVDHLIPRWVRHDVYLGLMSGAKGVAIWSLFKRPAVSRTWDIWYQAYGCVADELTGGLDLGRVFLFGTETGEVKVRQTAGPSEISLFVGDRTRLELGTITEEERKGASHRYPALGSRILRHRDNTYVFLTNSLHDTALKAEITFPTGLEVTELPGMIPLKPDAANKLTRSLAPFEVVILKAGKPARRD